MRSSWFMVLLPGNMGVPPSSSPKIQPACAAITLRWVSTGIYHFRDEKAEHSDSIHDGEIHLCQINAALNGIFVTDVISKFNMCIRA